MKIIKKDGTQEEYDSNKIIAAVSKSAERAMIKLSEEDCKTIVGYVEADLFIRNVDAIPVSDMHNMVEDALEKFNPVIAKSYRDYRNYKMDFVHLG